MKKYTNIQKQNVEIILNWGLDDIDDNKKIIKTCKGNYKYKLYLYGITHMTIPYFNNYKVLFDSVSVGNLLRIYAKFDVKKIIG